MKKTLVLTHEYFPFHGGVGRYCYNLFKRMSPQDYVVLTDQREINVSLPMVHKRLLSTFMKPSWLRGIAAVQQIIKKHAVDIIFTPHILPLGNIAHAIRRKHGTPYVVSLHGLDINRALERRRSSAIAILKSAFHIITNSAATKNTVDQLHLATPVTVLTPFLDAEKMTVDQGAKSVLAKKYAGKTVILTVGRLVKRKGQDMIIRALPQVLQRVPDVHYCIVGSGPDREYLQSLIQEYRVGSHVDIISGVSDRELAAYYAQASLFAMPTRAIGADVEGFGISYLEAAYFSLPIIAGHSGGEAEAVGDPSCGLVVNGEDVSEIVQALEGTLLDPELAGFLGRSARQHLKTLPDWDTQAKKLAAILS